MTLRWRLTALYLVASLLTLCAAVFCIQLASGITAQRAADRQLAQVVDTIIERVESPISKSELDPVMAVERFAQENDAFFFGVLNASGETLYQSDPELPILTPDRPTARFYTYTLPSGRRLRFAQNSLSGIGHDLTLLIGVSLSADTSPFKGWRVYVILLYFGLIAGLLGCAGWWIAGRALRPVRQIIQVAETIGQGTLAERIPVPKNKDEIGHLVRVLNWMLSRIDGTTTKLKQFSSNVSHQLKTPLTVLRGEIEVTLSGKPTLLQTKRVLKSNLKELESLSVLVDDLLSYARSVDHETVFPVYQQLDPVLDAMLVKAQTLADPKKVRISLGYAPNFASFHKGRLEQALLNVLDNAIKFCPPHRTVRIEAEKLGGDVRILIQDEGKGVPAAQLVKLFERGRSKTSTGIGLGLAKALVESFGGRMVLESPGGQGLAVLIYLSTQK